MKLYYWCPFFSKIATEKAVINSIESIKKFSKKKIEPSLIDVIGEWKSQSSVLSEKNIKTINLNKFKIVNILPKHGFIKSRFSYVVIFIISIFRLHKKLKEDKPEFLIIHLMTFIPLILIILFKYNTKFILRISGYPKLNFIRRYFWKKVGKKLFFVTTPTKSTLNLINESKIFPTNKLRYLPDPVLNLNEIRKKKNEINELHKLQSSQNTIISIGRLTQQKNFQFLINSFSQLDKFYPGYKLYILGSGEEKEKLEKMINKLDLQNKVFLIGYQKNIYQYLKTAKMFILTSLWEDPGFVLIEAGFMNKILLSSDCPNGPKELLEDGKNGFLFKTNSSVDFLKKFKEIKELDKEILFKKKLSFKKKIKEFTLFNHYRILNEILNSNEN